MKEYQSLSFLSQQPMLSSTLTCLLKEKPNTKNRPTSNLLKKALRSLSNMQETKRKAKNDMHYKWIINYIYILKIDIEAINQKFGTFAHHQASKQIRLLLDGM